MPNSNFDCGKSSSGHYNVYKNNKYMGNGESSPIAGWPICRKESKAAGAYAKNSGSKKKKNYYQEYDIHTAQFPNNYIDNDTYIFQW